jgi:phosphocarrier protein
MSHGCRVTVGNARGLHARAAALFAKTAQGFDAAVLVRKAEIEVDGTSIMDLLMLVAGPGCELHIEARGPEAEAAVDALRALVEAHFHE